MFIYNLKAVAKKLEIDYAEVTSNINHISELGASREELLKGIINYKVRAILKNSFLKNSKLVEVSSLILMNIKADNRNAQAICLMAALKKPVP